MTAIAVSIGMTALANRIANRERALTTGSGLRSALGVRVKQLVREGYDGSFDPYGVGWAALADGSGRAPLVKTGTLRGSYRTKVTEDEIIVGTAVPYAKYHQGRVRRASTRPGRSAKVTGTRKTVAAKQLGSGRLPRRPGLPDGRGMPDRWRKELRKVIRQFT